MKSWKKILALALTGSMVLGMLSITTLAEDNTDSVILPGAEIVVNPDWDIQLEEPETVPEVEKLSEEEELPEVGEGPELETESAVRPEAALEGEESDGEDILTSLPEMVSVEELEPAGQADDGIMLVAEYPVTLTVHKMAEDTTMPNGAREIDKEVYDTTSDIEMDGRYRIFYRQFAPGRFGWSAEGWLYWSEESDIYTINKWDAFAQNNLELGKSTFFPGQLEGGVLTLHVYLFYSMPKTDFELTYNTNGSGEGWTETFQSTADYFDTTVSQTIPQRDGYDFRGWSTTADGEAEYQGGSELRLTETATTLYAVWAEHIHSLVEIPAVAETCTETGWTAGSRCETCGEILVAPEEIPARGHQAVTVEGKPATCTETGLTVGVYCSHCGEVFQEQREIPMIDHTIEIDPAVPATCTTAGWTLGSHCTVCGQVITPRETIEPLGHLWSEEFTSSESQHWHVCTREGCEAVKDTADHTWDAGEVTTPPTCTDPGVRTFHCTTCDRERTEEIPAAGHAWDEGVVTVQPTTSRGGVRTYTCTECGETRLESIPRLPGGGGGSTSGGSTGGSGSGSGGTSGRPSGGTTTSPGQPEEDLGDEDVPLGQLPEEDLGDGDVPLTGLPFFFEDVQEKDWFYNSVMYVHGKGMMSSTLTSRNIFAPMTDTTRNMVITVLYRLDNAEELSDVKIPLSGEPVQFSDQMSIPAWANEAVAWGVSGGIIEGYRDGSFGGERNITRQELVTMLYRYAGSKGCDVSATADLSVFEDAESVSKFAREAMQWAVGTGIIEGVSKTRLEPAATATRAQVAAVLERFCLLIEKSSETVA